MTTRLATFTTTHGMVVGIHDNATVVWATSHPARATCLAGTFQSVIGVTYATYCCLAGRENLTGLSRRKLDNTVTTFA
jgi:hypothetical protein